MERIAQKIYPAGYGQLEPIRNFVEQHAEGFGASSDVVYDLIFAVTEIVTNVIDHGYKGEEGEIEIGLYRVENDFLIKIKDGAPVFDFEAVPEPDTTLDLMERSIGGWGLFMTKKLVDSVEHQPVEGRGNEITIVKKGIIKT